MTCDLNAIRERLRAARSCEPSEFVGYTNVKLVTAACESLGDIPALIAEDELRASKSQGAV